MTLKNMAYELINSTERHFSKEEYENSAMELVDVTSRSVLNVIEKKILKCGEKLTLLTADPQFPNQTQAIVFHSPDYEKKPKYPKKAKYDFYLCLVHLPTQSLFECTQIFVTIHF